MIFNRTQTLKKLSKIINKKGLQKPFCNGNQGFLKPFHAYYVLEPRIDCAADSYDSYHRSSICIDRIFIPANRICLKYFLVKHWYLNEASLDMLNDSEMMIDLLNDLTKAPINGVDYNRISLIVGVKNKYAMSKPKYIWTAPYKQKCDVEELV